MNKLPAEILDAILLWVVRICRCEKNVILPLRQICKAFDVALKPYAFKCIQLEFSRFMKFRTDPRELDLKALKDVGKLSESLYLDLMVVRDEEEIERLTTVFQSLIPRVPEMTPLLDSLHKYCMSETTFDEMDYRLLVESVLFNTPNMTRLKLNLPFQVVGQQSRTATLLLATTVAALASRPEGSKCVEHLVLDHVSDTTLIDICNNPLDITNTMEVFKGLKHLILSIKRQESRYTRQSTFAQNLWHLIEKATDLRSLCLIGWNVKRTTDSRVHVHGVQQSVWNMRSLPFARENLAEKLLSLRSLELKRVDMDPHAFFDLLSQISKTLKELYLFEVYLKVRSRQTGNTSLWIGYPGIPKPSDCCWLAEELYRLDTLNLDILRVSGIGYDDFEPPLDNGPPEYDLKDPSDRDRSFDERFVQAVMKASSCSASSATGPHATLTSKDREAKRKERQRLYHKMKAYDAETFQRTHNTTSWFKRCVDGYFFNHNEQALKELQNIITVADRGMTLLQNEMDRARDEHRHLGGVPPDQTPAPDGGRSANAVPTGVSIGTQTAGPGNGVGGTGAAT
ncbi:uncharacterized protein LY89DRAFT_660315 [Mollisia scopiformis]|uniref:Uncharacterized protein n=1 Tax=Mollisia scopiformis TaxID=149040 RepID=A0A132B568_MOLSC|nr:uncharacterized protein LY89DRAFT_660315 [Mollisia scopiformis]KUJ07558.1 hypothetical protein LY89DRAFT_660315 [Mollisia scopiformis]